MPGMDPQPKPPASTLLPLRDTYYQLVHTLRGLLPPPVTDTQEDLARRDNAAIAHVTSLLPVTADEADLTAHYVAAGACAMDCLRLAREFRGDPTVFLKCSAQASSMMREARAFRALLRSVQAERRKLEADSTAAERTEHCAPGLKPDVLGGVQPSAMAEPPAPNPVRTKEKPAGSAADTAAEADQYARSHRKRAALIRTLGRLPDRLACGPLSPELVKAIVTGTSPVLRSLGHRGHAAGGAAA